MHLYVVAYSLDFIPAQVVLDINEEQSRITVKVDAGQGTRCNLHVISLLRQTCVKALHVCENVIASPFEWVSISKVVILVGVLPNEPVLRIVKRMKLVKKQSLASWRLPDKVKFDSEFCLANRLSKDISQRDRQVNLRIRHS